MKKFFLKFSVLLLAVNCNSSDDSAFNGGEEEVKPKRTLADDFEVQMENGSNETAKKAAAIDYDLTVTSKSKAQLCSGTMILNIYSDFKIQFSNSKLKCGTESRSLLD